MKKNRIKQLSKSFVLWALSVLYVLTFHAVGLVLYYLSKIVRVIAFYLTLNPASARNELTGFWRMYRAIDDMNIVYSQKK
ncbi:hypothetical protein [Dysgonomonas sp. Marseille-P4361]|uniref:hypothetical protein n=1 Tax=Dysgonomonas sp. Marseille-P4361 TaxID=2161820 RepID=UPI000D555929|nr:hypothetical protein [Dysgonomonas sp. Marseille-P4361]